MLSLVPKPRFLCGKSIWRETLTISPASGIERAFQSSGAWLTLISVSDGVVESISTGGMVVFAFGMGYADQNTQQGHSASRLRVHKFPHNPQLGALASTITEEICSGWLVGFTSLTKWRTDGRPNWPTDWLDGLTDGPTHSSPTHPQRTPHQLTHSLPYAIPDCNRPTKVMPIKPLHSPTNPPALTQLKLYLDPSNQST